MCMETHLITTRNENTGSNLKRISKITKTRCSIKKNGLHSDSGFILSIKCRQCLLTSNDNSVMTFTFSSFCLSIHIIIKKPISKAQKTDLFHDPNIFVSPLGVATNSFKNPARIQ